MAAKHVDYTSSEDTATSSSPVSDLRDEVSGDDRAQTAPIIPLPERLAELYTKAKPTQERTFPFEVCDRSPIACFSQTPSQASCSPALSSASPNSSTGSCSSGSGSKLEEEPISVLEDGDHDNAYNQTSRKHKRSKSCVEVVCWQSDVESEVEMVQELHEYDPPHDAPCNTDCVSSRSTSSVRQGNAKSTNNRKRPRQASQEESHICGTSDQGSYSAPPMPALRPHGKARAVSPRRIKIVHKRSRPVYHYFEGTGLHFPLVLTSQIISMTIDQYYDDNTAPESAVLRQTQSQQGTKYANRWRLLGTLRRINQLRLVHTSWDDIISKMLDWTRVFNNHFDTDAELPRGTSSILFVNHLLQTHCLPCLINTSDGRRIENAGGCVAIVTPLGLAWVCMLHQGGPPRRRYDRPICDFCLIEDAVERRGRNRISFLNLCESEEEEQEEGETYWHSCQPCRAARFAVTWNEAKLPGSCLLPLHLLSSHRQTVGYFEYVIKGQGTPTMAVRKALRELRAVHAFELSKLCDCRICQRQKRQRDADNRR